MAFHLYQINEIFSNASGTVQFIELFTSVGGQQFLQGHAVTIRQGGSNLATFTFGSNRPGDSANTSVLLATQGFADLGIVTPDYILPNGFLPLSGGEVTVDFASVDSVRYTTLPTDGTTSINRTGATQLNSPTNFARQTGTVPASLNVITGTNGADNLNGTAGADDIKGLAGNDTIKGNAGDDLIDGGTGVDTAVYSGNRSAYTITNAGASVSGGGEGSDTLANNERLKFADFSVAFDFGAGHAAMTAKLLGAVFGSATLANRVYVGIGLSVFDSGSTYEQVADLAIHAALGTAIGAPVDNAALVRLLYTNIVGSAPSQAEVDRYVGLIADGTFTPVTLTVAAADHPLNASNIGLTGLAQNGLEFLAFPA